MKRIFKIQRNTVTDKSLEEMVHDLEWLEYDICLPKDFYTYSEWLRYSLARMKLVAAIAELKES